MYVVGLGYSCNLCRVPCLVHSTAGNERLYVANTLAREETAHLIASVILVILGTTYILMRFSGKGDQGYHKYSMKGMAVAGLVPLTALSPCSTTLPLFLAVAKGSDGTLTLTICVHLVSLIAIMLTFVTLSYCGAAQLKFRSIERNDKLLVGTKFGAVGILTHLLHDHDHIRHVTARNVAESNNSVAYVHQHH